MPTQSATLALAAVLCLAAAGAHAQQPPAHDHAHAAIEGEVATVHFATTCAAEVQPAFDRAVAMLHSFGYEAARGAFEEVAGRDPGCAMAWWGVAMSYYHPIWAPPPAADLAAGLAAVEKAAALHGGSAREEGYVAAIGAFFRDADRLDHKARAGAYRAAMEALARRLPDDSEAEIFYALALLATAPPGDPGHAQERRAGEILNRLLERQPHHPGIVHYLIHSFDYPGLAEVALPAARLYATLEPASPHAQHMPSHIFTRLGLWRESVASNLASEASADAIVAQAHPGAASYDALHALDYLEYAYLQTGDYAKAREVLERSARAVAFDVPNFAAGYALAAIPARFALERDAWAEAARLEPPAVAMPWEQFPYALAITHFARTLGAAGSGDLGGAREALARLEAVQAGLARTPPAGPYDWAGQVESMRLAAAGWLARAEGHRDQALGLLRQAADLQDRVGKHPVTPGEVLPARELLADLLGAMDRPAEALAEYSATLTTAPNRLRALSGAARAATAAGEEATARDLYARIGAQCAPPAAGAEPAAACRTPPVRESVGAPAASATGKAASGPM